jgi:hypothetical protein
MTTRVFDDELIDLAEEALGRLDFSTRRAVVEGVPCVLAENEFFILAVSATATLDGLRQIDQAMSLHLASEVAAADVAEKQWDVYLVLLTTAQLAAADGDLIYRLAYNTHYLRRLVRTDVAPSVDGARRALLPFGPLPKYEVGIAGRDPLSDLEASLPEHGVPERTAHRAVAGFRTNGEVPDV